MEDSYQWPPDKNLLLSPKDISHSAPGRLLLIAEKLLDRSQKLLKGVQSVTDAIQAARLELEAKEILIGRTPTITLEALALQHQAEVEAECMFYGVEYDLNVDSRIKDIQKEIKSICEWFHPSAKKRSQ